MAMESPPNCPICLEEGTAAKIKLIQLPCSHFICESCKLKVIGGACPFCRAPMPPPFAPREVQVQVQVGRGILFPISRRWEKIIATILVMSLILFLTLSFSIVSSGELPAECKSKSSKVNLNEIVAMFDVVWMLVAMGWYTSIMCRSRPCAMFFQLVDFAESSTFLFVSTFLLVRIEEENEGGGCVSNGNTVAIMAICNSAVVLPRIIANLVFCRDLIVR